MLTKPRITVVGLGPGDIGLLTLEARDLLATERVYLRTKIHPTVEALPQADGWPSFDPLYEQAPDFDALYETIVTELIDTALDEPIVYAVPGHPLFGESTVRRLIERSRAGTFEVRIVPGVSYVDAVLTDLSLDPLAHGLQIVDALELAAYSERQPFAGGTFPLSPLRPALVAQIYSQPVTSAAKLALLEFYEPDYPVIVIESSGTAGVTRTELTLHEIDRHDVNHLSTLYLPPGDALENVRLSDTLQHVVALLRAPDGCPWDREQTHQSLTVNLIEEAYEVLDAIERDDASDMAEELGDLLLQVYLHAQIAAESGTFALEDVFESITSKLIRRHPHVFGDVVAETSGAVVRNWDEIKRQERQGHGGQIDETPLGKIPLSLPALARAQTMIKRAQRRGLAPETIARLESMLTEPVDDSARLAERLAALALAAQEAGIDAESTLRDWTQMLEGEVRRSAATTNAGN